MKKKGTLGVILAIIIFAIIGLNVNAEGRADSIIASSNKLLCSKILFGSYPQSEIDAATNSALIAQIDAALSQEGKNVGDVTIEGIKYRKADASYGKGGSTWWTGYRYFKWEPVSWYVWINDKTNKRLGVVAEKALDYKYFFTSMEEDKWPNCELGYFLNDNTREDGFLNPHFQITKNHPYFRLLLITLQETNIH